MAHRAVLLYYVYVVMMISLLLLKLAHMAFYLIDLQMDFWYTVGIYKMIEECEVYIYGEKKSFKKTRFVF